MSNAETANTIYTIYTFYTAKILLLHGIVVETVPLDPGELFCLIRADEDGGRRARCARPTSLLDLSLLRRNFMRFSLQKFLCH